MNEDHPERPQQAVAPLPGPRNRAGAWLASIALVGPIGLILAWYAIARVLDVQSSNTVWALAYVMVPAGLAALVWFGERNRIARRWTALAAAGYLLATGFWAIFMFLVALELSCGGGADTCFN